MDKVVTPGGECGLIRLRRFVGAVGSVSRVVSKCISEMAGADRYILELQIRDVENVVERYAKYNNSPSVHAMEEAVRKLRELERSLESFKETED